MSYFKNFPYVQYDFPDDIMRSFKNISIRPAIVEELKNTITSFDTYDIKDGDTPETVAFDFYGDVNLHWLIMLSNDILNVYRDWPMSTSQFDSYLRQKYGTLQIGDSEYVLDDDQYQTYLEFSGEPANSYQTTINFSDGASFVVRPHHFETEDGVKYNYESVMDSEISLPDVTGVSIFSYENTLNENKRSIIIPKGYLVEQLKKELRDLLNE